MQDWLVTVQGPGLVLAQGTPLDDRGMPQQRPAWGLPKPDMHGRVSVDAGGMIVTGRLVLPMRGGPAHVGA